MFLIRTPDMDAPRLKTGTQYPRWTLWIPSSADPGYLQTEAIQTNAVKKSRLSTALGQYQNGDTAARAGSLLAAQRSHTGGRRPERLN